MRQECVNVEVVVARRLYQRKSGGLAGHGNSVARR
jgi:hypothetical protein